MPKPPVPPERRAFGLRVRGLRLAAGMTQEDLAERAGLHRTYIVGVETGERNLSLDAMHKLARGLRCSPAAFFSDPTSS